MQGSSARMHDSAQDTARPDVQPSHLKGCQACLPLLQSTERLRLRPLCVELCKAAFEHVLNLQYNKLDMNSVHRHVRRENGKAALEHVLDV